MEELKKQIEDTKMQIIRLLIIAIVLISLIFSFTVCYMTYQSYNYDYIVPNIENNNTNTNGGK